MVKVCLLFAFTVRRVVVDDMIYEFTMSKPKVVANPELSNEDMILALAGQFKQLSHEPEKFR